MKSYTVETCRSFIGISYDDALNYNKTIAVGIRPIDLIPLRLTVCIILDVLQLFIPPLRLRRIDKGTL